MKKTMKKIGFFFVIGVCILLLSYVGYVVKHEDTEQVAVASSTKKIVMVKGDTMKLSVSSGETVKWKSSKKKIATISKSGKLKAKKKGSTKITATYTTKRGKTKKITYTVKVVDPKLNVKSKITLNKGDKKQLKIKYAKNKIKWRSSKSSVVKVTSSGKITARKAGKATITATYHGKKYKTTITVKDTSNKDDNGDDEGNEDDEDDGGDDNIITEEDEIAYMESTPEWQELWLQVDIAMLATYTGDNMETYEEASFIAFKELAAWYAERRYSYKNYEQFMADINAYGYPEDKLVKFTDDEIKKKKDLEELYNSYEWELLWTIVDKMLALEYDPENHVEASYNENYKLAEWYLAKKDSYENLEQLNADVNMYGYPDSVEYKPYVQEIVSYPDVAKQVLDEINAYRKSLNAAAGYEKYEPYIWSDENAHIAKTQAVYNMKSCLYRNTWKDDANHGVGAIGTSGGFTGLRTDERKLGVASSSPEWAIQNWIGSPTHIGYLQKTLTSAMVLKGFQNNIGIAVVSSTWSDGTGHITVMAYTSRCETPNVITINGLTPADANLMYTDSSVPISLGTSFYGSEITTLFSDVREIKGTKYNPLTSSPYAAYYGTGVESETVSVDANIVSVSENSIP